MFRCSQHVSSPGCRDSKELQSTKTDWSLQINAKKKNQLASVELTTEAQTEDMQTHETCSRDLKGFFDITKA